MRKSDGCRTASSIVTSVFIYFEARKDKRDIAIWSSLAVSVAVAASFPPGVATGKGWVACTIVEQGTASSILGPNFILFSTGKSVGQGTRTNWDGNRISGVGVIGLGEVETIGSDIGLRHKVPDKGVGSL